MTRKKFERKLINNGYEFDHYTGSHAIWIKPDNTHISIPYGKEINQMMAQRLIKENQLL